MGSALWAGFLLSTALAAVVTLAVARGGCAALDLRLHEVLKIAPRPRADGKPPKIVAVLRDLAALGGDTLRLLMLGVCTALLLVTRRDATAAELVALFVFARIALVLIKRLIRRPRPVAGAFAHTTYTSSFPSGHTAMSVVLFLSLALLVPAPGSAVALTAIPCALVIGAAIGAARVILGMHWPSDVIVGWSAGVALTTGAMLLLAGMS